MSYIAGDFWRICEVCGFKTRSSMTKKRWDGLFVCLKDYEERHPQDFVRGRKDVQNVPDARPEPLDTIIGPLTTRTLAASLPGSSTLTVESSVRFLADDHIGVVFSDGSMHTATLLSVPDEVTLTMTTPLSGTVPIGAIVIDYSAVSNPDLG